MRKIETESKVINFVQRYGLILPGHKVVVAVSGGADSVSLLHILAKWQRESGIGLQAAHLNHQLRGAESDMDAEYVSDLARSLGIPLALDRQDVGAYRTERNCSLEEAARELRYRFLAMVATEVGAERIAVGHTRDDQVETILMHILRGTGIAGLCGLAPCLPVEHAWQGVFSGVVRSALFVIRPLLDITRDETTDYCQKHRLHPRVDSSNRSLSFFRNRLRLRLLPVLRQYNPNVDQALLRLSDIAREDSAFIEQQASQLWDSVAHEGNDAIYLDKKQVANLPVALQRQLLRAAVARLLGDTRDVEVGHIEAMRDLLGKPVGKMLSLPRGLTCHGEYDQLVIARLLSVVTGVTERQRLVSPCPFPPLRGEFSLQVPGETVLPGWRVIASVVRERLNEGHREPLSSCHSDSERSEEEESPGPEGGLREAISAHFDLQKTGSELFVRHRRPGDSFQPLGMSVEKKLQDFMVDAKIPRSWRDQIPIVCSAQQIIWVTGWRIDDRVKVTEDSKAIIRLEFMREP